MGDKLGREVVKANYIRIRRVEAELFLFGNGEGLIAEKV